ADEFYAEIIPSAGIPSKGASSKSASSKSASSKPADDAVNVQRQALAGMLWSKQFYYFDANQWLDEHRAHPLKPDPRHARNRDWVHLVNEDVISMPDKWEYPWYAAWDLAFHT